VSKLSNRAYVYVTNPKVLEYVPNDSLLLDSELNAIGISVLNCEVTNLGLVHLSLFNRQEIVLKLSDVLMITKLAISANP